MSSDLKATIPQAVADKIGAAASAFLAGRYAVGGGMTIVLPPEIGFRAKRMAGFVRVTPTEDVRIEGGLVDVFLESVDVFPKGSRSVFRAQWKRWGLEGVREFGPTPSAPLAGALGLASIPDSESTGGAPILTWLVEPETPPWLAQVRTAAQAEGYDVEAASKAVAAVRSAFPVVPSGGRRVRRPTRRQAINVGMVAAGVPAKWRALWWVASWFVPAPIRLLIEAVIWGIDRFSETT